MSRFLSDKQQAEISEVLEDLGIEYGIPLKKFDNILLTTDPMRIIYNHEVIGLCKSEVQTKYFEDGDKEALRECMRAAVIALRAQLAESSSPALNQR